MSVSRLGNTITLATDNDEIEDEEIFIDRIEFVTKAGAAGDEAIITDTKGEVITHFIASGANYGEQRTINKPYFGVKAETLGSKSIVIIHTK